MDPLFYNMLSIDSTSGSEREFALMLRNTLSCPDIRTFEVGDGTLNLLLCWGEPRVVFCTHMDTVPPYIPPVEKDARICGRGACDAKGQIFAMYSACKALEAEGLQGFGLLLLSGEETGSWGAKAFAKTPVLAPGSSTTVELTFSAYDLASFDESLSAFVTEALTWQLQLNRDASTIVTTLPLTLKKTLRWPVTRPE